MQRDLPDLKNLAYDAQNFADLAQQPYGEDLWGFLRHRDNLIRMETAVKLGRAPVEALSDELVYAFGSTVVDDRTKQMIGHMARQVMEAMGYRLGETRARITRPSIFSTAANYVADEQPAQTKIFSADQRAAWLATTRQSDFNLWLDAQVKDGDGTLNLAKLYRVAEEHGVKERYDHLNPGQQRMNIGNRLRKRVDPKLYKKD